MSLIIDDSDFEDFEDFSDDDYDEELEDVELDEDDEENADIKNLLLQQPEEDVVEEDVSEEYLKDKKYANGISNFKEALMRKYAEGLIDAHQYFTELLELEIYENAKIKTVPLTTEGLELIKEIRENRVLHKQKLLEGDISQLEHDEFYIKSLRDEKQIIKDFRAKVYDKQEEKGTEYLNLDIDQKLEYLIKKEDQLVAKLAKKNSIPLKKPNSRLKDSTNPDTRATYLYQLSVYEQNKAYIMDRYLETYKVKRMNPTGYGVTDYDIDVPLKVNLKDLFKKDPVRKLISDRDMLEQEKVKYLKKQLRELPKEVLLQCLKDNNLLTSTSSYIRRLEQNTVPIFKFVQYPKDQLELNNIIDKELIAKYSVTRELLEPAYETKIPSEDSVDSTNVVCLPGKSLAVKVPFKGVPRNYVGNIVEIFIKDKVRGEDLSNLAEAFEPVYPIPDPLYNKIAQAGELKDKVAYVYQLYIPVPGYDKEGIYVTSRYTDFKEYLVDLKGVLASNLLKLEGKGDNYAVSVLQTKINKINYYLDNGKDPDLFTELDKREEVKIEIISQQVEEIRNIGKSKLNNFILSINSNALPKVTTLEERIYIASISNVPDAGEVISSFNKPTYEYLVLKVLLIFNQYPDMLHDYLNGNISPDIIIKFETPLVNEEDFTKEYMFKTLDDKNKLNRLLEWLPNNELYNKYKYYIDKVNSSKNVGFKTDRLNEALKNDSIMLDKLEIDKIIQEEYEMEQWEKYKKEIMDIEKIPSNFTPDLWKFKQLNKKRYTLPSMRIYRVASIKERVNFKEKLIRILSNCNLSNFTEIAYMIENIIYTKSEGEKDYKKYSENILSNYKKFCSYFREVVIDDFNTLDYMVAITEYFHKEGEALIINRDKVMKLVDSINNSENIEQVLKELSEHELKLYRSSLLNVVSPEVKRRFKLLNTVSKLLSIYNASHLKLYTDKSMIYVKPHLELQQPEFGEYIFIDGKYLVGGNYPPFKDDRFNTKNYSSKDLRELAELFEVQYLTVSPTDEKSIEDIDFDNYLNIMNKIDNLTRPLDKKPKVEKTYKVLDYKIYAEPRVTVQYTMRPRMGVPDPGEIYYTSKDYIKEYKKLYPTNRDYYERNYAVPYTFENFIPVYHVKLKELADKKLIVLEGPAIFKTPEEDKLAVYETSPFHIFVEYKDSYGNLIYFKEGVSQKRVKTASKDSLDTCNRFKNEKDCNNLNSFSLDSRKCLWDKNTCVSSFFEDKVITSKDIWEYMPLQEELKIPWTEALVTAKKYIKDKATNENLGEIGVSKLLKEQSQKLYNYKIELEKNYKPRPKVDIKPNTSIIEFIQSIKREPKSISDKIPENYKLITIETQHAELKKRSLTSREIKKFKTFNLEDLGKVDILSVNQDETGITVEVMDINKNISNLPLSRFIISDTIPSITTKSEFVYVSNEDYEYLNNPPESFSWTLKKLNFEMETFMTEEIQYVTNKVNYVDTQMIIPSGKINETPLITRQDIDEATYKLAFSEYIMIDNKLQLENKINASKSAIKLALDENISLLSNEFKLIIREITVDDILKVIESKQPKVVTLEEALNTELKDAIKEEDKFKIEEVLKKFKKVKIEPVDLEKAEAKLKEITERIKFKTSKSQMTGEVEKDIDIKAKEKKDSAEIFKKFKSRSVISSRRDI